MTPIAKQPQFIELQAEYTELSGALAKVQAKRAEIVLLLQVAQPVSNDSAHVAAALAFASTGRVSGPTDAALALSEEEGFLRQQEEALKTALLARWQAMQDAATALTQAAWKAHEPKHKAIAKRYAAKLRELDALAAEEDELLLALRRAGYDPTPREFVAWPYIGRLADRSAGVIYSRVAELERYAD